MLITHLLSKRSLFIGHSLILLLDILAELGGLQRISLLGLFETIFATVEEEVLSAACGLAPSFIDLHIGYWQLFI